MLVRTSKVVMGASLIALAGLISAPASAGPSDDECAIWLCLPTGFIVGECNPAFKAMVKRVTSFPPKSPLPLLHQCLKGPGDTDTDGSFEHTESRWVPCPAGTTQGWENFEDLTIGDRFENVRVCRSNTTGQYTQQQYGPKTHYVTVTIDGVTYDTYSFEE